MSEPNANDLLREWRGAMQSVLSTVTSVAGRSDAAKQLLVPIQRQMELFEQVFEQQQRLQGYLVDRVFEPVEAVFELLESAGAMMRDQAEALEQAADAVQRAAGIVRVQAEMFETATRTVRKPAGALKSAAGGGKRRPADT